jgi:hypothetical protein
MLVMKSTRQYGPEIGDIVRFSGIGPLQMCFGYAPAVLWSAAGGVAGMGTRFGSNTLGAEGFFQC